MPFDWIRTPIDALPTILAHNFCDFLTDCEWVERPPSQRPVLRDVRHGLTLLHDDAVFAAGGIDALRHSYLPKIERFRSALGSGNRVVFVRGRASRQELVDLEHALRAVYPQLEFFVLGVLERHGTESRQIDIDGSVAFATGPAPQDWRGCPTTWQMATSVASQAWNLTLPPGIALRANSASQPPPSDVPLIAEIYTAVSAVHELISKHPELSDCISPALIQALIAAEDHRYYFHRGIDPIAITRALTGRTFGRNWGGGSTIEQQLYRTLSNQRAPTLRRKLRELIGATALSVRFDKQTLAQVYLTVAYYGADMNGIQQALHKLGLDPQTLTTADAASIVARLKYPEPRRTSAARLTQIQQRTLHILQRMSK